MRRTLALGLLLAGLAWALPRPGVATEALDLPGYPEPHTPSGLNRALALRYFRPGEPPQGVLLLVPGLLGGAGSLDLLARGWVEALAGWEVWALDRRSHPLEDRSGFLEALKRRDPGLAYAYYVRDRGRPGGFRPLPPEALGYMVHWGLEVHLEDLHVLVRLARARAGRVLLGGHSLGAALAALYAARLFEDGPGQDFLDGLLLLDGAPLGEGPALASPPGLEDLFQGRVPPYLTGFGLGPEALALLEVAALLAHLDPEGTSPLAPFPASNLAWAGILASDRYAPWPAFSYSLGEAVGARLALDPLGLLLGGSGRRVAGLARGARRVEWRSGGATDLRALVASWSRPETNYAEWYFPLRLLLDLARLRPGLEGEAGFIPQRQVHLPTLAVGAGRGLYPGLEAFAPYLALRPPGTVQVRILPGLTHLDLVAATPNPLYPLVQAWLAR